MRVLTNTFSERQMNNHEISLKTNLSEPVRTRSDFTYKITPTLLSIVDTGPGPTAGNRGCRGGLTQDRVLASRIDCGVQDHVSQ
jgi:hypothetical protein